nr:MAG TPA: Protein of unknown function (DUF1653) [Caudoviricetes sp.]
MSKFKSENPLEALAQRFRVYRHYKGGDYSLLGVAKLESDLTEMAIYRKIGTDDVYVRPLSEFNKKFKPI